MVTLQFVPYGEIKSLDSDERIAKLLDVVKQEKIVLLEGRLRKKEEAELIRKTMESISKKFKGIELAVVNKSEKSEVFWRKLKEQLVGLLLGDRQGFTIIGPATIVKEIKKDPDKIQLYLK